MQSDSTNNGSSQMPDSPGRIVAIASGKGGVGKTTLAVNLAYLLTQMHRRVILFDGDLGLANVDILLGLKTPYNLRDVLLGDKLLEDIIVTAGNGFKVIPASSGVRELAELPEKTLQKLIKSFEELSCQADDFILDIGAGIGPNAISLAATADSLIIVTLPEPAAVTDAYAMIKVVSAVRKDLRICFIMNLSDEASQAEQWASNLESVCRQFLDKEIEYLGHVSWDDSVKEAARKQKAVVEIFPDGVLSRQLRAIAMRFFLKAPGQAANQGFKRFVTFLLEKFRSPRIDNPTAAL